MSLVDKISEFFVKQAVIRGLNEILGAKVFGLGALTHSTQLGGWVDANRIDGYTYNEADGHWYTNPPAPDLGSFNWSGPASNLKENDLDTARDALHNPAHNLLAI